MKKSRLAAFGIIVATIIAVIIAFASDIRNSMTLGLDLQGGFEILYQVTPLEGQEMPDMEAVVSSVRKRVDVLGVSEPEITVEGNDRIRVSLAGVDSPDQARRIISSTANLTFRDVNDNLLMDASVLEEGGASVGQDQYGNYVVNLSLKDSDTLRSPSAAAGRTSSSPGWIMRKGSPMRQSPARKTRRTSLLPPYQRGSAATVRRSAETSRRKAQRS